MRRDDVIDDAMTEIRQRIDDEGGPLPDDFTRDFAEAIVGRLADDYLLTVDLLHRWLVEASAMGDGPRARLTQDTLDAVGMPGRNGGSDE